MDILTFTAGILVTMTSVALGIRWQIAKRKLSEIRHLIDSVDEALYDDKVSEKEFQEIFQKLMTVVKGHL